MLAEMAYGNRNAMYVAAQAQTQAEKYRKCVSDFQNSTVGKVVSYGSLLSFLDNFKATFRSWAEVAAVKLPYWKVVEWGAQSAAGPSAVSPVITTVTPIVTGVGTAGVALATFTDLTVRSGCAAAAQSPPWPQPALWTGGS